MENDKLDISQKGLEKLLIRSLENFQEERDLALERYRRQDESMTTADDFVVQGKNAVDYLKTAADRSNAIFAVAKLVKDIVFKPEGNTQGGVNGSMDDEQKKEILKLLKESEG
jgi:hypothetical protein